MRSTLPLFVCLLSFLDITQASVDECDNVRAHYNLCAKKAFEDYKNAYLAGDDGRPDWLARKSCNYMTAAVEDCGDMLVGKCHTCKEVTKMKDEQMRRVLEKVKSSVTAWDSDKCPASKAHIERMLAVENGEKIESSCNFEDVPGLA